MKTIYKTIREQLGLSQQDLAGLFATQRSQLAHAETGYRNGPIPNPSPTRGKGTAATLIENCVSPLRLGDSACVLLGPQQ